MQLPAQLVVRVQQTVDTAQEWLQPKMEKIDGSPDPKEAELLGFLVLSKSYDWSSPSQGRVEHFVTSILPKLYCIHEAFNHAYLAQLQDDIWGQLDQHNHSKKENDD